MLGAIRVTSLGLLGAGLFLAFWNVSQVLFCDRASICVDDYWLRPWLVSYEAGQYRRALIGTFVTLLAGDYVSIVVVNIVSAMIALGVTVTFSAWVLRLGLQDVRWFLLPILSGPSVTVLWETLGDVLQASALIALLVSMIPGRLGGIVVLLSVPLVGFIHEAAFFLVGPTLMAVAFHRFGGRISLARVAAVPVVFAVLVTVFLGGGSSDLSAILLAIDGTEIPIAAQALPSLKEVLAQEVEYSFGSYGMFLWFLARIAGSAVWPVLLLTLIGISLKSTLPLRNFLALFLIASPLFVIAHDWGRFFVFLMIFSLAISALRISISLPAIMPNLRTRIRSVVLAGYRVWPEFLVAVALAYEPFRLYRIVGLHPANLGLYLFVCALFFGLWQVRKRHAPVSGQDVGNSD